MSDRESGGFTSKVEDFPCLNKSVQFSSVQPFTSLGLYSRPATVPETTSKTSASIRDRLLFKVGFNTRQYGSCPDLSSFFARKVWNFEASRNAEPLKFVPPS